MGLDDGVTCVWVLAVVNDVQIFFQIRSNCWNVLLLLSRCIEPVFRIERIDLLSTLIYIEDGDIRTVIAILYLGVRPAYEGIGANVQLVAIAHFFLRDLVQRRTKDTDKNQRHPDVNNVATVAAGIAMRQVCHRREKILPSLACDHASAANELRCYGK